MRTPERVTDAKDEPILIPWAERDLTWRESNIPFVTNNPGWHASLIGSMIAGASFRFFPIYLPFGHARPFHIAQNVQCLFFMLEGQMELGIGPNPDDLRYFQLGKYDTLFVPVGMGADYRNTGQTDVRFVMAVLRVGEWPKESIYYLPGQEKPFARKF